MAKRKVANAPGRSSVRVSVKVGASTHVKLHALAAMRGVSISAVLEEAAEELVKDLIVINRARRAESGDPAGPVKESATDAA